MTLIFIFTYSVCLSILALGDFLNFGFLVLLLIFLQCLISKSPYFSDFSLLNSALPLFNRLESFVVFYIVLVLVCYLCYVI